MTFSANFKDLQHQNSRVFKDQNYFWSNFQGWGQANSRNIMEEHALGLMIQTDRLRKLGACKSRELESFDFRIIVRTDTTTYLPSAILAETH